MDWNKSKNIILVILLITNIFLIAVYGGGSFVQKKSENNNAYQYTMNVLEENNIVYKGQIYNKLPKMTTLTVSYGKYDRNLVQKNIKNTRKTRSRPCMPPSAGRPTQRICPRWSAAFRTRCSFWQRMRTES